MGITQQSAAARLIQPGVCTSSTRPASPFEGQAIFETDTDRMLIWNGTTWVIPNAPAQNPTGLELVKTQIFSTATNADVTDVFSATYDNYVAILTGVTSTAGQYTDCQLLNGTTPKTSGYDRVGYFATPTVNISTDSPGTNQSGYRVCGQNATVMSANMSFYRPNISTRTTMTSVSQYGSVFWQSSGVQTEDYVATGFRILASGNSATFTGTIRVYGYRN